MALMTDIKVLVKDNTSMILNENLGEGWFINVIDNIKYELYQLKDYQEYYFETYYTLTEALRQVKALKL